MIGLRNRAVQTAIVGSFDTFLLFTVKQHAFFPAAACVFPPFIGRSPYRILIPNQNNLMNLRLSAYRKTAFRSSDMLLSGDRNFVSSNNVGGWSTNKLPFRGCSWNFSSKHTKTQMNINRQLYYGFNDRRCNISGGQFFSRFLLLFVLWDQEPRILPAFIDGQRSFDMHSGSKSVNWHHAEWRMDSLLIPESHQSARLEEEW